MFLATEKYDALSGWTGRAAIYRETEADMDTPVSILSRLIGLPRVILLESAKGDKAYSRFSFLAFDMEEKLTLTKEGFFRDGEFVADFSLLEKEVHQNHDPAGDEYGDFRGGYVGYLNYEFVETCGILRKPLANRNGTLGVFYLVEKWLVYDNYANKAYLAISGKVGPDGLSDARLRIMGQELDEMEERLAELRRIDAAPQTPRITRVIPREEFMGRVKKIKQMIEEGEAIQVVLSDYLEVEGLDPLHFYRNLRRINPSPYMYFLKDGDSFIVGSSPEVHIRIKDGRAVLKPIAGTRPRAGEADIDEIIRDLSSDEKEKAEHLMLVDLARNDLARICRPGTVRVEGFMKPEVYSHVVHLVSLVAGEMRERTGIVEALKGTFPAGTVSGAPKTRAIEIIDKTEGYARGAYAGCLGYIGFDGSINMAITIRTAYFSGTKARFQAGAGIVYDSDPEREYLEVMNKLGALTRAGGVDDSLDR